MEKNRPTPGPYRCDRNTKEIIGRNGVIVALALGPADPWIDSEDERRANLRLLAASWELHRQLKAVAQQLKAFDLIVPKGVLDALESVALPRDENRIENETSNPEA